MVFVNKTKHLRVQGWPNYDTRAQNGTRHSLFSQYILHFFCSASISVLWTAFLCVCVCICIYICVCVCVCVCVCIYIYIYAHTHTHTHTHIYLTAYRLYMNYLLLDSSWNVMAHRDERVGKWRGNWRMQWVASTLHTTSEHGVSSITTADAHTSAASSRLNWRPRRFEWTRPFRRKKKSGFCACAITFQTQSITSWKSSWKLPALTASVNIVSEVCNNCADSSGCDLAGTA